MAGPRLFTFDRNASISLRDDVVAGSLRAVRGVDVARFVGHRETPSGGEFRPALKWAYPAFRAMACVRRDQPRLSRSPGFWARLGRDGAPRLSLQSRNQPPPPGGSINSP